MNEAQQKMVADLEKSIRDLIEEIRDGKQTPTASGIGHLFAQLRSLDIDTHKILLELYRPISDNFYRAVRSTAEYKKQQERKLMKQVRSLGMNRFEDDGEPYQAKERPNKAKKQKVAKIKPEPVLQKTFEFKGESYGKGPLVLAVLRHHVECNKKIGLAQMQAAFPDSLLRGYGIFKAKPEAEASSKNGRKRYFLNDDQTIKIADAVICVCNQFTSDNIGPFIDKAKQLGHAIK